jgi:hypothetical protein
MDMELKQTFLARWRKYFDSADLPITFEYTDHERHAEAVVPTTETKCLIAALRGVREGHALRFSSRSFGCASGRFYAGFSDRLRQDITQFLSCGAEGKVEGERYKKTPELAAEVLKQVPWYEAPTSHLVFKRWDKLEVADDPEVVIFFATADVLSGLFTLSGFDEAKLNGGVIVPFGSGCASIIQYPYVEAKSNHPRAIIGMFDVSARPYVVAAGELTFSVPMTKFETMVDNMDESFLITQSWDVIRRRIGGKG